MNTKNNWLTTATIHDQHRRAVWGTIFENATVPIKSILPAKADLPGHPQAEIYLLDLDAITDDQREQIVKMIHRLFGIGEEEVRKDIAERGVPILAEGVNVTHRDQGGVFLLFDDPRASSLSGLGWTDDDL